MEKTFGKKKLIRDISANTLQAGIAQLFGLIIFYMTSKFLSKEEFGDFNWSMAVGSTIIAIASLGLDLVFVKRIATGENVLLISGIHLFHTVFAGLVICMGAYITKIIFPEFNSAHPVFFLVFVYLAISNIANSFKLCLNGIESYRQLAALTFTGNVFKLAIILYLYFSNLFTINNVVYAFVATALIEFILGYLLTGRSFAANVKPILKVDEYKYFILESLPQLGVVLFDSALARVDWILLGILTSASVIADYSFTYKIYELSKLPLLIVAPILLTRFSKMFNDAGGIDDRNRSEIRFFFKIELFLVMFIPIVMICAWTPLVDYFTSNKYGSVNELNYWILAPCVPIMCMINFLWTLGFVQGQLKQILYITIAISLLNIVANLFLIPVFSGTGSAISFLACTVIQLVLYYKFIRQDQMQLDLRSCLVSLSGAILSIVVAKAITNNIIFTCIIATLIHVLFSFITGQINIRQLKKMIRP